MAEEAFNLVAEDCSILQADGWQGRITDFEASLSRQLGGALPVAVGQTTDAGECRVIRIAPRRFWLVGERQAGLSIDPELGCLISLREGRVRMRMAGSRLLDVLASCVAIDWLAPEAAPGRAIQTGFHRVPVLLLRQDEQECDLLAPRSFAKSLSDWLIDVAEPLDQPPGTIIAKQQALL
jgi:heterotetrameric sarcosine oxidase gamma subunit